MLFDLIFFFKNTTEFIFFLLSFLLVFLNFILSIFNEDKQENILDDDKKEKYMKKKSFPLFESSVLSRIVFWWVNNLIITGYKKELKSENMWKLPDDVNCNYLTNQMEQYWNIETKKCIDNEKRKKKFNEKIELKNINNNNNELKNESKEKLIKPSLIKCLFKLIGGDILWSAFFHLLEIVAIYLGPFVLGETIRFNQNKEASITIGYFFSLLLFLSIFLKAIFSNHHLKFTFITGTKIKTALMGLIYKKALSLSPNARKDTTVGEMVNVLQVNTQTFENLAPFINMTWSVPLQLIICTIMLWSYLGVASLFGLIPLFLSIPVQIYIIGKNKKHQINKFKNADTRIKLTNEVLNGIKVSILIFL